MDIHGISHGSSYQRRKGVNLDENLAVTIGGGFFGGILIGFALKKIVKIVAIIAGFFLACPGVFTIPTNRQYRLG